METEKQVKNDWDVDIQRIRRVVSRMAGQVGDVDDITQECCARVIEKEHLWDAQKGSRTSWLNTLVRNFTLTHLKYERRRQHAPLEAAGEVCADDEELFEFEDNIQWVLNQFKSLPPMQKKVLQMKYFDDMKVVEIAEALQVSRETVSTHLRRALETFRRRARKDGLLSLLVLWWDQIKTALLVGGVMKAKVTVVVVLVAVICLMMVVGPWNKNENASNAASEYSQNYSTQNVLSESDRQHQKTESDAGLSADEGASEVASSENGPESLVESGQITIVGEVIEVDFVNGQRILRPAKEIKMIWEHALGFNSAERRNGQFSTDERGRFQLENVKSGTIFIRPSENGYSILSDGSVYSYTIDEEEAGGELVVRMYVLRSGGLRMRLLDNLGKPITQRMRYEYTYQDCTGSLEMCPNYRGEVWIPYDQFFMLTPYNVEDLIPDYEETYVSLDREGNETEAVIGSAFAYPSADDNDAIEIKFTPREFLSQTVSFKYSSQHEILDLGDIVFRQGFFIKGHVFDQEDRPLGASLKNVKSGMSLTRTNSETGAFAVGPMEQGVVDVEVSAYGFLPQQITLETGKEAIAIKLQRGGRVSGTVTDSLGKAVSGVELEGVGFHSLVATDAEGRYVMTGLPDSSECYVKVKSYIGSSKYRITNKSKSVKKFHSGDAHVDFVVKKNVKVSLVFPENNKHHLYGDIEVWSGSEMLLVTGGDFEGPYALYLPPGKYHFKVGINKFENCDLEVEVGNGEKNVLVPVELVPKN